MSWAEFLGWLKVMGKQVEGEQPDPYSWRVKDPWFSPEAKRQRMEQNTAKAWQ